MFRLFCVIMCAVGHLENHPQPLPQPSSLHSTTHTLTDIPPIPVVFVCYGELPLYLRLNIELAARYNDVIIISDVDGIELFDWPSNSFAATSQSSNQSLSNPPTKPSVGHRILFEPLSLFSNSANQFAPLYKHLSPDTKQSRVKHELRCFQRWFILKVGGSPASHSTIHSTAPSARPVNQLVFLYVYLYMRYVNSHHFLQLLLYRRSVDPTRFSR